MIALQDIPLTQQRRQVLEWLLAGQKITQQYASRYGVERLGARIWDLRNKHGVVISARTIQVIKQSNQKKAHVKQYGMERAERQRVRRLLPPGALGVRGGPVRDDRPPETGAAASIVPEPDAAVRPAPTGVGGVPALVRATRGGGTPARVRATTGAGGVKGKTGKQETLWEDVETPRGYD